MLDHASDGFLALESRLLLNASPAAGVHASRADHHVERATASHAHDTHAKRTTKRLTPTQEINAQFAAFTAAFNAVLTAYVQSINEQSTGTVSVSTTVTTAYTTPGPVIEVADASVFGPEGTYTKPVTATALIGTVSLGTVSFTGSSGNLLIINPAQPATTNLPVGTVLSANVPTSALTSAASIFPSYITNSTIQMATNLVKYFNSLPIKLPPENAPPHTPIQRGAIQSYVYQNIASSTSTSLQQLLLAITLPTTPGSDLQIYQAAVTSAIAESQQRVLDGVGQIFNRTLLINAVAPANRLGEIFNTSSSSSSGASSTSASTSGASSTAG
jgi:hypothetical protein